MLRRPGDSLAHARGALYWFTVCDAFIISAVGLLDDHNPYPGRASLRPIQSTSDGGKRWALCALAVGLMWFWGFGSLFAIAGGAWARTELRDAEASPRIADFAILVGIVGLVVSAVLVLA